MSAPERFEHEAEITPIDFLLYAKLVVAMMVLGALIYWLHGMTEQAGAPAEKTLSPD